MRRRSVLGVWVLAVLAGICRQAAAAEELAIDLSAAGAAGQWAFLGKTGWIRRSELIGLLRIPPLKKTEFSHGVWTFFWRVYADTND